MILIVALLGLFAVGCGVGHTQASPSALRSVGNLRGRHAAPSVPPLRYLNGDYDGDDYYASRHDADNDDSSYARRDRDNDSDNGTGSYFDRDDSSLRDIGRAADPLDRHSIVALLRRYFAAAVAEDGARACAILAASIARSVPQTLGQPPGPPYLAGTSCAPIVSKVFEQDHRQLVAYARLLHVSDVRVTANRAVVILDVQPLPGREIWVQREDGVWKIDALLDNEMP
jgi:hypothetical protein